VINMYRLKYVRKTTTVKIPVVYVDIIDQLVNEGKYTSRNEFIVKAIHDKLKELGLIKSRS